TTFKSLGILSAEEGNRNPGKLEEGAHIGAENPSSVSTEVQHLHTILRGLTFRADWPMARQEEVRWESHTERILGREEQSHQPDTEEADEHAMLIKGTHKCHIRLPPGEFLIKGENFSYK
ncbi:hypothetical protein LEMLEM_LOCUS23193, partial [Lemmus lemmus]